jgi:cytochrome c nitrite reductase small subunit
MINKILHALIPPPEWKVPVIIALGVLFGMGLLIFRISNASSYLSDNPQACINCHVMTPQYATWQRSSHVKVASCNDCHVPHENFLRTYAFKASDGTRHAFMFTFRLEPQVIRIKEAGLNVVQDNCIRCHYNYANETSLVAVSGIMAKHGEGKLCFDCHRGVPHGLVNSLSSHPFARVPQLTPVMPEWIQEFMKGSQ